MSKLDEHVLQSFIAMQRIVRLRQPFSEYLLQGAMNLLCSGEVESIQM